MIKILTYIASPEHSAEVLFITKDNKEEVWEFAKSSTSEVDRKWFDKGYEDTIGFYAIKPPDDSLTVLPEYIVRNIFNIKEEL